ncbi:MAG: Uma2 family endonuclease [Alphaproteobacteria bacterium]|nr:Uma2 family endonuclease [Alphaproteobacteria bacterium]
MARSLDEYFEIERTRADKHEYWDGTIFLMAGGSARHNVISANAVTALALACRAARNGCRVLSADQRLASPDGLYTYADASLVCGAPELGREQTLSNPTLVVEVLSDATRDYDRGEKLARYQQIPSLQHVLLVEQARAEVTWWRRATAGWTATVLHEGEITLERPGLALRVEDLYEGALDLP